MPVFTLRTFASLTAAIFALTASHGHGQQKDKPDAPSQPNEAMVMQVKLQRSQTLLGALTREDYKTLEENAESLVKISDSTAFLRAYKTAEYELEAQIFKRTAAALGAKAKDKNLDGATLAYTEMTLSCVRCHNYFRGRKKD
jgi:cytochrome c556